MINDPRLMPGNSQVESWSFSELFADFLARSITYPSGFDCVDGEDKIAMVATQSANLVRVMEQRVEYLMERMDMERTWSYREGYKQALKDLLSHGK